MEQMRVNENDHVKALEISEAYIRVMAGAPPTEDEIVSAILAATPTYAALDIFETERRASSDELVRRADKYVSDAPEVWGGVLMDEPERMAQLSRVLDRVRRSM
jgi:hypothetical protein